jgi:hypothetical protein
VLRPIGPDALNGLLRAADASDAELDLALLRIGVLAPADLAPIRAVLTGPEVALALIENRDGHRVIEVSHQHGRVALVHHDGTVEAVPAAA